MKSKKIELDVDFIGGERTPTEEDFKAISEFIKAHKARRKIGLAKKTNVVTKSRKKVA